MTLDWSKVLVRCHEIVNAADVESLNRGQQESLLCIATGLQHHGMVLADEVGLGKTRIACAMILAVLENGGRVATVVPRGLMHQWQSEFESLQGSTNFYPRRLLGVRGLGGDDDVSGLPWVLISQHFLPVFKGGSRPVRYSLPPLALCEAEPSLLHDKRGRYAKYWKEVQSGKHSDWATYRGIAKRVGPLIARNKKLLEKLRDVKPVRLSEYVGHDTLARFRDDGGESAMEAILGHALGTFDLVVIDEAHKRRGGEGPENEDVRASRLTRLLTNVVRAPGTSRRLCLTATPMELRVGDWLGLLDRARSFRKNSVVGTKRSEVKNALLEFEASRWKAEKASDQPEVLEGLATASTRFETALAPFVTRRRRTQEPFLARFRDEASCSSGASHPHRRFERVEIDWSALSRSERQETLALEGLSIAIRGIASVGVKLPSTLSTLRTKLSTGHLTPNDVLDRMNDAIDSDWLDATIAGLRKENRRQAAAKLERVAYWANIIRESLGSDDRSSEDHPRLRYTLHRIWQLTRVGADAEREKVLVFGVLNRPLRNLRNLVRLHEVLDRLDLGLPVPSLQRQEGRLWHEWQWARAEGHFSGQLSAELTSPQLQEMYLMGKHEYEKRRDKASDWAKKLKWPSELAAILAPGKEGPRAAAQKAVSRYILEFVLDSESSKSLRERSTKYALERLATVVGPIATDYAKSEKLAERLRERLHEERPTSLELCSLLNGETKEAARKAMQAGFNRAEGFPRILIAQSVVGREGLNFHESCRHIINFHPEWNPAVIEQQIGRVDRMGSRWERLASKWMDTPQGEAPFIHIHQIVFSATYDEWQWKVLQNRKQDFDASLFGSLLSPEAWAQISDEERAKLTEAAPDFSPSQ